MPTAPGRCGSYIYSEFRSRRPHHLRPLQGMPLPLPRGRGRPATVRATGTPQGRPAIPARGWREGPVAPCGTSFGAGQSQQELEAGDPVWGQDGKDDGGRRAGRAGFRCDIGRAATKPDKVNI
ncbi:hypothetical protein BC936DRAFT_139772 [Jimgerdemannia flammicorona]|uniref:Uncharacterized protein n=1 Tax=Jimgerdemannia flammicorona TaxID=994334 RepID=A0A433B999_9FUNG|nr:hypothetical protein BC936DRAFT_139772 [Jimgerdemannia flammicorona]